MALLLDLASAALRNLLELRSTPAQALDYLNADLDDAGVTAFDTTDSTARHTAIARTIDVSLRRLASTAASRFRQLVVFPEDIAIPLAVIDLLWERPPHETRRQCVTLHNLALLKLDLEAGTVRLHDVMRAYLVLQAGDLYRLHGKLLDAWGDPPQPPDLYAWRWWAYHAEQAARLAPEAAIRRARTARLIQVLSDDNFPAQHLKQLRDPAALDQDLQRALAVAVDEARLEEVGWVVQAARALNRFRRETLTPALVFALASAGDIEPALRQLALYSVEREWQQAATLLVAWQAAATHPREARALFARVAPGLPAMGALTTLRDRVYTALTPGATWPAGNLPTDVSRSEVEAIVRKLAGNKDPEGGQPTEETPGLNYALEADPNEGSYQASLRITVDDSWRLVGYAAQPDPAADEHSSPSQYVRDSLAILAANSYKQYRNLFLWPLLNAVLQHPEPLWAKQFATATAEAALSVSQLEFQEGVPITILALQARHDPGAHVELDRYRTKVTALATLLEPDSSRGDSWGSFARRLAHLAQGYHLLREPGVVDDLLAQARRLHYGFAGFQSPAQLTLADAVQVCGGSPLWVESHLERAGAAAHNVQEVTFCALTTARYNALRHLAATGPATSQALTQWAKALRTTPGDARFAARHHIGELYTDRARPVPPPSWSTGVNTLARVAGAYHLPVEALLPLNPGITSDQPLSQETWVNIPDAGLPPLMAAHLAAVALTPSSLNGTAKVAVLANLVLAASPDPTALDTVLARLLLGAAPALSPAVVAELAQPLGELPVYLEDALEADRLRPDADESWPMAS